jgi:hypothetical protein
MPYAPPLSFHLSSRLFIPCRAASAGVLAQAPPPASPMQVELIVIAVAALLLLFCCVMLVCRIWKRNRYYKKVQHSLDEEERAFQECVLLFSG